MNVHLIMALGGFGGVILVVFLLMLIISQRRPDGSNGGTDVSSWGIWPPSDGAP